MFSRRHNIDLRHPPIRLCHPEAWPTCRWAHRRHSAAVQHLLDHPNTKTRLHLARQNPLRPWLTEATSQRALARKTRHTENYPERTNESRYMCYLTYTVRHGHSRSGIARLLRLSNGCRLERRAHNMCSPVSGVTSSPPQHVQLNV